MCFFPCMPLCLLSITAALAGSGERRMRRMKSSEKVNPTSPEVWAKRLSQGITAQWSWLWGRMRQPTDITPRGKMRPPEAKVCQHHN